MDTSIALRFGKVVSALEVITKQTDNENLKLKEMLEAERDAKQKVVSSYAAANCEWEYKPYDTVRKDVAAIIQSLEKIAVSSAHLKLVRDGAQARLKLVRDGAPLSPPRKRASELGQSDGARERASERARESERASEGASERVEDVKAKLSTSQSQSEAKADKVKRISRRESQ